METPQLLLLVLLGLRTYTSCLHLPPYIKPCSRNDPNINACAKEHAIHAVPQFIKGDPKYRVPSLEPLLVEQVSIPPGMSSIGMALTATNATFGGLNNLQVKDIRIDLKNQHMEYEFLVPSVEVHCRYNVSGQVLFLPITGNGDGELVFKDVDALIRFDYDKVRRTPNEKEYLLPKNFKLTVEPHGMTLHLDNLFNGNKLLGDNMNTFMNENWKELVRDLAPPVGDAIGLVVEMILTNMFERIPFDEVFPETVQKA